MFDLCKIVRNGVATSFYVSNNHNNFKNPLWKKNTFFIWKFDEVNEDWKLAEEGDLFVFLQCPYFIDHSKPNQTSSNDHLCVAFIVNIKLNLIWRENKRGKPCDQMAR